MLLTIGTLSAQEYPLTSLSEIIPNSEMTTSVVEYRGKTAIRATHTDEAFQNEAASQAIIVDCGSDFIDGTIELEVASDISDDRGGVARGFVGVAFRVEDVDSYEAFYIRPANGRADDQFRRNHSTQYISHPDYEWERLRSEFPSIYESYSDMVLGEWTKLRIEVSGSRAEFYVGDSEQPSLIVKDLKRGADSRGGIALWLARSTVGYFRDLKVTHAVR